MIIINNNNKGGKNIIIEFCVLDQDDNNYP